MKQQVRVTAPKEWASAIVNGDYSGLDGAEQSHVNTFLAEQGLSFSDCIGIQDAGILLHHDAAPLGIGQASCNVYTFIK